MPTGRLDGTTRGRNNAQSVGIATGNVARLMSVINGLKWNSQNNEQQHLE